MYHLSKSDVKLGDVFWCILPSIESEGYGEQTPREPWRGQIVSASGGYNALFKLAYLGKDGEPDLDSNATSYCRVKDLFCSKQDAVKAYKEAMQKHIEGMEEELAKQKEELRLYCEKGDN